jgi:hypothetical protein
MIEKLFFSELRNAMREPRNFAARCIAMHDALLRRADDRRFGFAHGGDCPGAITGGDGLFDFAHRRADVRAPRFIDDRTARDLAGGLSGGFRISHEAT